MAEVEVHSAWFQPDPVDTRERMRVGAGAGSFVSMNKLESDGIILYEFEFIPIVLRPSREALGTLSYQEDELAVTVSSKRWFETVGELPPGLGPGYDASMFLAGGASHIQDPYVVDLSEDIQAAAIAAVLAGELPGVPPVEDMVGGSFSLEFEPVPSGYPAISNRSLEVTFAVLESKRFNRAGTLIPGGGDLDDLSIWATPLSEAVVEDVDHGDPLPVGIGIGLEPILDAWYSPRLENRGYGDTLANVYAYGEEMLAGVGFITATVPIDDAWFEANAWPAARFDAAEMNRAVPLTIGPSWMFNGELTADGPYGTEKHTSTTYSATIYVNATWTPQRYRIVYEIESTVIPPRRIFQRSDGLTHGARRVGSGNTRQSGSRTLGAIL